MRKLDILAFGAHPDDVEIGMGATLAKYVEAGYRVGICDLTKAELSSNGTVEIRQAEAKRAADVLGIDVRIQLTMADRGLKMISNDELAELVSIIRKYRPSIVFAPFKKDRHPDHGACAKLIEEAVFNAGIKKYPCKSRLDAYRPRDLYYYFINGYQHPDFVVDVTKTMEKKKQALMVYESQFVKTDDSVDTPLTNDYIAVVEGRERLFGKEVGVAFAEGFMTSKPIIVPDFFAGEDRDNEA
ncbi:bacillithiol biosynthesis deacetylase BshB1 [Halalkalibacter alkalisediminis]|uniref:Bacillithiol biosynthesis deacetylase BshB1 n=1 Tax=Halalkalibacter alkalisediminis TaxID=935616 RepID=A0ABV6NID8_9BACI|nr:bacillithiol biosynthesis deacetylase BshB1 [Halalkalibacter alkalisediminis]